MATTEVIDTRGLICPLPVIRLQERFRGAASGIEVEVVATDPGALEDIPLWCRVNGHTHLTSTEQSREYRILVRSGK